MIIFAIQFLHLLCSEFVLRQTQSNIAGVVKLVDTLDLGSSASRCEGSSPFARTKKKLNKVLITELSFFVFYIVAWRLTFVVDNFIFIKLDISA